MKFTFVTKNQFYLNVFIVGYLLAISDFSILNFKILKGKGDENI